MDLPDRKPTRLKGYDYSRSGVYFVTICVRDKRNLLGKIVGGDAHIAPKMQVSKQGEIVETYLRSMEGMDKFVVMPNHVHAIIKIGGPMWASAPTRSISDRVRSFKILVTKHTGFSIFQRSFHDHIIRNETDYLEHWDYIENNPAKWELDEFYTK